jgi:hypothetical protein
MIVSRKSPLSGETNTMDIAITRADIINWEAGSLIQDVMPNITATEREFIMTGITAEDRSAMIEPNE